MEKCREDCACFCHGKGNLITQSGCAVEGVGEHLSSLQASIISTIWTLGAWTWCLVLACMHSVMVHSYTVETYAWGMVISCQTRQLWASWQEACLDYNWERMCFCIHGHHVLVYGIYSPCIRSLLVDTVCWQSTLDQHFWDISITENARQQLASRVFCRFF